MICWPLPSGCRGVSDTIPASLEAWWPYISSLGKFLEVLSRDSGIEREDLVAAVEDHMVLGESG